MKKRLISLLLAALMLLSCGVAVLAADITNVEIVRTFEPGGIGNQSLYRFKAVPYATSGLEYKGTVSYQWTVLNAGIELDNRSYTHEQARNFFAFQPPSTIEIQESGTQFTIKCVATIDGVEFPCALDVTLFPKLPASSKDALKAAISVAAFRSEKLYTKDSWNRMLTCYYEACEIYKDNSLSTGATVGGVSDIERIKSATQALINASAVTKSGDGLIVDPANDGGFMGTILPIFEKITAFIWSFAGFKLGGLEIPFSQGLLGSLL